MIQSILTFLSLANNKIHDAIFVDIFPGIIQMPFLIGLLIFACVFFTIQTRFINFRYFKDIFDYKSSNSKTDVDGISSIKSLITGIAGSVGVGSIAGVAIAVNLGGPGAVFWIFMAGVFSMSFRFVEVFLAHRYREIDSDGKITLYGPYAYMVNGLKEFGFKKSGVAMSYIFAVLFCFSSLGGANSFQSNQSVGIFSTSFFHGTMQSKLIISFILSIGIGVVIIGGIKRIASFAHVMVTILGAIYLVIMSLILFFNRGNILWGLNEIISSALNVKALLSSFIPALIHGVQRSLFADEVGFGSVPMMHSSSSNKDSFDEAIKSMAGPFFCSSVVCTLNGFALVCSKSFLEVGLQGAEFMRHSYSTVHPYLANLLPFIMLAFSYCVAVSWFYYGESSISYLLKNKKGYKYYLLSYKLIYCLCFIFGAVANLDVILIFMDNVTLGAAIPNTIILMLICSKAPWKKSQYKPN